MYLTEDVADQAVELRKGVAAAGGAVRSGERGLVVIDLVAFEEFLHLPLADHQQGGGSAHGVFLVQCILVFLEDQGSRVQCVGLVLRVVVDFFQRQGHFRADTGRCLDVGAGLVVHQLLEVVVPETGGHEHLFRGGQRHTGVGGGVGRVRTVPDGVRCDQVEVDVVDVENASIPTDGVDVESLQYIINKGGGIVEVGMVVFLVLLEDVVAETASQVDSDGVTFVLSGIGRVVLDRKSGCGGIVEPFRVKVRIVQVLVCPVVHDGLRECVHL